MSPSEGRVVIPVCKRAHCVSFSTRRIRAGAEGAGPTKSSSVDATPLARQTVNPGMK